MGMPPEVRYEDSEGEGRYRYEIQPSGALLIHKRTGHPIDEVEDAYGPGAWFKVRGDMYW